MAIRTIVLEDDPVLRKKSRPVEKFDQRLWELLDDMADTMHKAQGVGLAAPQVGVLRRVVVVDIGEGVMELVNPEILETSGAEEDSEGCLSFPGQYGLVTRPTQVKIKYQDRHGQWQLRQSTCPLIARAFCHETDHLNGVLFVDKVSRMLSPEELEEMA